MTALLSPEQPFLPLADDIWIEVHDANDTGRALFHRHYSYVPYRDGRRPLKFVGPGENMVLLTVDARALFVWRKFISQDKQTGINCSIFRNEGPKLSSDLIREADQLAWNPVAGRTALHLRQSAQGQKHESRLLLPESRMAQMRSNAEAQIPHPGNPA